MIIVYTRNGNNGATEVGHAIRPCPLISISYNPYRNKVGTAGGTYDITLTGTLISFAGSPLGNGDMQASYNPKPTPENVPILGSTGGLSAILEKQNALRELFAVDGRKIEVSNPYDDGGAPGEPVLVFYPRLQSISFQEGIYVNTCNYTINLQADYLLDNDENVITDGLMGNSFEPDVLGPNNLPATGYENALGDGQHARSRQSVSAHIAEHGGFVEDFSETWSIEAEDGNGNTTDPDHDLDTIRTYRLTRNVSATGKTSYDNTGRYEAWQQAKSFIKKKILKESSSNLNGYSSYPKLNLEGAFASGFMNLALINYGGYNHSRTESIDKTGGSYSLVDTWLLSSGTAYENYNLSISRSLDTSLTSVTIDGSIKGLSSIPASGYVYGGNAGNITGLNTPYENALNKYKTVSNDSHYGITSHVFKRAQNAVGVSLNPIPLSVGLGANEFTGEITYNVQFDTRPVNLISGVLSENISVQDTYPGDVFAIIPVLGRQTGPVLQYIGGRTEYRRSLSIDIVVADTYGGTIRQSRLLSKPILIEPYRTSINNVIYALSPAFEPGIRKWFLEPPSESWDPKEKRYSITLNWVYELDH